MTGLGNAGKSGFMKRASTAEEGGKRILPVLAPIWERSGAGSGDNNVL